MVWYGMVWYGMVWYGMVWYGMVRLVSRFVRVNSNANQGEGEVLPPKIHHSQSDLMKGRFIKEMARR